MKDPNIALIKHVNRRLQEFLNESEPENFEIVNSDEQLYRVFAHWLRQKEMGNTTGAA